MINKILKEQLNDLKFFSFVVNNNIENSIDNIEKEYVNYNDEIIRLSFIKHNILDINVNDLCFVQIDSMLAEDSFSLNEGIKYPSDKMFCKIIHSQKDMIFCEIFSNSSFNTITHMLWLPVKNIIDLRKL